MSELARQQDELRKAYEILESNEGGFLTIDAYMQACIGAIKIRIAELESKSE